MVWERITFLVLILCPKGLQSATWSGTLHDGDRKYVCNGHDLSLDWQYRLGPGESLEDIKWFFHGPSEELIATYLHHQFFSSPPFSRRVQFVDNAGLTLSHVTTGDSGNYSAVVTVLSSSGSFVRLESRIYLDVRDRLLTDDGRLHLRQNPVAVRDHDTGQMSLELWCGDFNYNGTPPFPVQFLNPQGVILSPKDFVGTHFTFLLPAPVEGGTYTCRIPSNHYDEACLQGAHASDLAEASLDIVDTQATIQILQAENADLTAQLQQLLGLISGGGTLTSPVVPSGGGSGGGGGTPVAFYAEMRPILSTDIGERTMRTGDVFVFDNVQLNEGGAYNSLTGIFTAPTAGAYYFSVIISSWALSAGGTTGSQGHGVGFCVHVDGVQPDGRLKCAYSPLDVATESFQHQLQAGNRVWIEAQVASGVTAIYNAKMAHFSGFLIDSQT